MPPRSTQLWRLKRTAGARIVGLADVHSGGPPVDGHVDAVVDDEGCPGGATLRRELSREWQQFGAAQLRSPGLQRVGAPLDGGAADFEMAATGHEARRGYDVDTDSHGRDDDAAHDAHKGTLTCSAVDELGSEVDSIRAANDGRGFAKVERFTLRVVNVASAGQVPIDFDDLMLKRSYDGWHAYRQSKLAQIMFTFELAERLEGTGVVVNALHPATFMDTKMVREVANPMSSVDEGAAATLSLVSSAERDGVTGKYFDGVGEARAHPQAYDRNARRKLWGLSEEFCGLGSFAV